MSKESGERSPGQTPFTVITKVTKTASPKIKQFPPPLKLKKEYIKEIKCNFLVLMLQCFFLNCKIFILPLKS